MRTSEATLFRDGAPAEDRRLVTVSTANASSRTAERTVIPRPVDGNALDAHLRSAGDDSHCTRDDARTAPTAIDHTRRFIRDDFTPLYHTPAYSGLLAAEKLRYNQLHALYFNEQVAFFEREILSRALSALLWSGLPRALIAGVRTFYEEEQQHTAMFRTLSRQCAPQFYAESDYHFVRVGAPSRMLIRLLAGHSSMFSLFIWLALLQEERSLHYSRGCLELGDQLEPHFVAVHRRHLADEVGHVRWDEALLDWLWPRLGGPLRFINARLLTWLIIEYFLWPKRSGANVVTQLGHEFPRLDPALLQESLRNLRGNVQYRRTLYSPRIAPRSFARYGTHPEFASLLRALSH